ncbi:uncharacterized protein LOC124123782 [Haliotis rufescens]|uniref:uncharacterized protein LOC124123782 n=1 Tax=Haliotis rufescens TaxID=6454 RepID=UPI00201F1D5C|nr:uncharacterized protein LOC124123782 [Haliotis rufescens]
MTYLSLLTLVVLLIIANTMETGVKLGMLRTREFDVTDCIYPGICRAMTKDETEYFRYNRQQTFFSNLSVPVEYNRTTLHDHSVVPNIVHITWYGGPKRNTFLFHHFVSLLAIHKFLKPKVILFWFDLLPEGVYWDQATDGFPEIVLVYRAPPTTILGQEVHVPEHQSDVIRIEAVMEFGGIYMDLDALVVQPFSALYQYEVTMGYETPDGLCNGIIVARPWADFLKIWYEEYKTLDDSVWGYHSATRNTGPEVPKPHKHRTPVLESPKSGRKFWTSLRKRVV